MTNAKSEKKVEKRGRPTVMTKKVLEKLEQAFAIGCSDIEACSFAGIGKSTLYDYQNENPDFLEQKEIWKEKLVLKSRNVLAKSINKGNVDTAKWYLERKKKHEFSTKVENESKVVGVVGNLEDTKLTSEEKDEFNSMIINTLKGGETTNEK